MWTGRTELANSSWHDIIDLSRTSLFFSMKQESVLLKPKAKNSLLL
jgi:hypothetical protein